MAANGTILEPGAAFFSPEEIDRFVELNLLRDDEVEAAQAFQPPPAFAPAAPAPAAAARFGGLQTLPAATSPAAGPTQPAITPGPGLGVQAVPSGVTAGLPPQTAPPVAPTTPVLPPPTPAPFGFTPADVQQGLAALSPPAEPEPSRVGAALSGFADTAKALAPTGVPQVQIPRLPPRRQRPPVTPGVLPSITSDARLKTNVGTVTNEQIGDALLAIIGG